MHRIGILPRTHLCNALTPAGRHASNARMSNSLSGKTILVTGANSGIGYAFCEEAVRQNAARIIVAGRDAARTATAAAALGPTAVAEVVDVSSLASIDAFVARARTSYPVIDVLVDNAGIVWTPHSKSPDGFEITLATNLIGLAHLTNSLVPNVSASPTGRIVIVTATPVQFSSASAIAARLKDVGGRNDTATTFGSCVRTRGAAACGRTAATRGAGASMRPQGDVRRCISTRPTLRPCSPPAARRRYIDSKVFASLYGKGLQRYLAACAGSEHVLVASCDPGGVNTPIQGKMASGFLTGLLKCVRLRCPLGPGAPRGLRGVRTCDARGAVDANRARAHRDVSPLFHRSIVSRPAGAWSRSLPRRPRGVPCR